MRLVNSFSAEKEEQKIGELEKNNYFKNFDLSKLKRHKPPKNESLETFKEIKDLSKTKSNSNFVKDNDDIIKVFEDFSKKNDLIFPKEKLKEMSFGAYDNVIKKLKYHFNRPRPKELAKQYGVDLNDVELKSMNTPSYPSGHSAQGRLIANYLNDLNSTRAFTELGNNISDSRNVAKAHYESDSRFGKKLGDVLYNYIKK